MNLDDFAYGVLMEAMSTIPADVLAIIGEDIGSGEYFTSLVELIERAPQVVSVAAVDVLARQLATLPDGPHRTVGLAAVARFRHLERA